MLKKLIALVFDAHFSDKSVKKKALKKGQQLFEPGKKVQNDKGEVYEVLGVSIAGVVHLENPKNGPVFLDWLSDDGSAKVDVIKKWRHA